MIDSQPSSEGAFDKAQFYRRYRPPLPSALLNDILARVRTGALLDLGCGTGRVAVALAGHFREVVAVDPDAEMIEEGRKNGFEARASNITWHLACAEEFTAPLRRFDLITIGDAFHRLDQNRVLSKSKHWLTKSAGIAILQSRDSLNGTEPWHRVVAEIVEQWSGAPPYEPASPQDYETALRRHDFTEVETVRFVEQHVWSAASVVGNLHSTGYCSKSVLGDRSEEFVDQVTLALQAFVRNGGLPELLQFSYTFGRSL